MLFPHRAQISRGRPLPRAGFLLLALVSISTAGCGGGGEWTPPPVSALPVWPGPTEKSTEETTPPAAPAGPTPIAGDLPGDIDTRFAARADCFLKECPVPGLYPPMQSIDGKAPAAVWAHDIESKGQALIFPKHSGVDLYGITLKGSVTVKGDEAKNGVDAGRWVAFRAPGAGLWVTAKEAGSRVLFAVVGGGKPISEVVVELRGKDPKRLAWKARPSPIEITDLAASKDLSWAGGAMHARIGFEGAKQKASLGILIGSKDAPVAPHTHDESWEMLVALRASGVVKRADKAGATELSPASVKDGVVVAIPKATLHTWEPDGTTPLYAVQLYVPAGPEQRFKKLAEAGRAGGQ